jgi:beta-1,4-mannosyl-glycoprotein beta-1,4-N-acetylglucosaminyltransferase
MLELRLEELNPIVDKFIIVEADKTHTGKNKPFYFEENKNRFKKWSKKIKYIKIKNLPAPRLMWLYRFLSTSKFSAVRSFSYSIGIGAWRAENFQRNSIMSGLDNLKNEDIVLVGDLDEIPSREGLKKAIRILSTNPQVERVIFNMKLYKYCYNCLMSESWQGTRAVLGKTLLCKLNSEPQKTRTSFGEKLNIKILHKPYLHDIEIKSGWHLSTMGGIDKVRQKIMSFAHTEVSRQKEKNLADLSQVVNGALEMDSGYHSKFEKIDNTFPSWIIKNKNKLIKLGLIIKK